MFNSWSWSQTKSKKKHLLMMRTDPWDKISRDAVIFQYLQGEGVWLTEALKKPSSNSSRKSHNPKWQMRWPQLFLLIRNTSEPWRTQNSALRRLGVLSEAYKWRDKCNHTLHSKHQPSPFSTKKFCSYRSWPSSLLCKRIEIFRLDNHHMIRAQSWRNSTIHYYMHGMIVWKAVPPHTSV